MKPYKEYKDSGVPWIGEIPKDWEVNRIKFCTYVKGRIGWQGLKSDEFTDEGPFLVTGTDLINGYIKWETCYHISEQRYEEAPQIQLKNGDLLITKDGTIGKIAIVNNMPFKAILNSGLFVTRPLYNTYIIRYMYWLLNSNVFWSYFGYLETGSTIKHLYQETFENFSFPLPSCEVQHRIADYLDRKTAALDTLIADKQKMIELLKERRQAIISEAVTKGLDKNAKMKYSGIPWLGEIPEDWIFEKFNLICSTITDYVASGSFADLKNNVQYYDDENYAMLIRTLDVSNKNDNISRVYVNESAYNFLKNSNVYGGEIILPNIGASVGDVYIVPKLYKKMTLGPNTILFKTRYNDKYYYYYFCSKFGRECLILLAQSAAQPKFNKTELRRLRVLVPNTKIQNAIVNYLDKKTTEIDNLIYDITTQIEKLKEYRQAIISEAVTGKVEI